MMSESQQSKTQQNNMQQNKYQLTKHQQSDIQQIYAISVKNLYFGMNGVSILKNINLNIERGQFTGLIGSNGAGKTTLLKCLNGIYSGNFSGELYDLDKTFRVAESSGMSEIVINGISIKQMTRMEIARQIALMHQNTNISFPYPAHDVVMTGRYPYLGRLRREGRKDFLIVKKCMEYTDTLKFRDRPVTSLSGGERQRVFFARVLAQETDILLLDEPTASLDIAFEEQIFKFAAQLCEEGKTVVAAVHDLKIAAKYCSRLVLMRAGEIFAEGTPEEVLTNDNISAAYGVRALVYRNRITGILDFFLPGSGGDRNPMSEDVLFAGLGEIKREGESGKSNTSSISGIIGASGISEISDISHLPSIAGDSCKAGTSSSSSQSIMPIVSNLSSLSSEYCISGTPSSSSIPDKAKELDKSRNSNTLFSVSNIIESVQPFDSGLAGMERYNNNRIISARNVMKVHIIGGGGSAAGAMRLLFEKGYDITAGVLAHGDSDLDSALVFGIQHVACKPFSDIDDVSHAANVALVREADITVLCNMPFGHQNLRNLEAAATARRLVIIEDDDPAL
ncbi:MAG: ABC transporter ATP-binding protein, partial [Clostridiales bacterium]|nr:ABC transporter ATP-binding protein [Clostridiales bacterium]